jgi:hypothetical protein
MRQNPVGGATGLRYTRRSADGLTSPLSRNHSPYAARKSRIYWCRVFPAKRLSLLRNSDVRGPVTSDSRPRLLPVIASQLGDRN